MNTIKPELELQENNNPYWVICQDCKGHGKKRRKIRKKTQLKYELAVTQFEKKQISTAPVAPKGALLTCSNCSGMGLIPSSIPAIVDVENYPNIAIIGAGIGGVALAVACSHRGIPFTLYERDLNFNDRSQGYGLTLQQASRAIEGFGIKTLDNSIITTRHIVYTTDGEIIGEWGMRKWKVPETKSYSKRTNIHIGRQSLRQQLLDQLGGAQNVKWNHKLIQHTESEKDGVNLSFQVGEKRVQTKADLIVGADGIRSAVRKSLFGDQIAPLNYLGCLVILGICNLNKLKSLKNELLDSATVFQTVNSNERMYAMPYDADSIMWQFSFPILEDEAKELSAKGPQFLKKEVLQRVNTWHQPIPQIIEATAINLVSGYPIYDRKIITPELLKKGAHSTLIGDAAHPMSPFKGQGANQALLDALILAREISKECRPLSGWKENGIRKSVLDKFELEMVKRSAVKVKDSAKAVQILHSDAVLRKFNGPRGQFQRINNLP